MIQNIISEHLQTDLNYRLYLVPYKLSHNLDYVK